MRLPSHPSAPALSTSLREVGPRAAWVPRVVARGGRVFVHGKEAWLTLPGRPSEGVHVLVPVGHGKPRAARFERGVARDLATGAACAEARWRDAGGVAARAWRALDELPAGVPPPTSCPTGPWVTLRTAGLGAWQPSSAVSESQPVVAVGKRGVLARNRAARVAGLELGAAPTGSRVKVLPAHEFTDVRRALGDAFGRAGLAVEEVGHGGNTRWRVRLASADAARRLVAWAWCALRVELRAGVAADPREADMLAGIAAPGMVLAATPAGQGRWLAARAVATVSRGRRVASWRGDALPDLTGIAARAASLVEGLDVVAPVRVELVGERGRRQLLFVPMARGDARLRDAVVRARVEAEAFGIGEVRRISAWVCAAPVDGQARPQRVGATAPSVAVSQERSSAAKPCASRQPARPPAPAPRAQLSLFA